MARAPFNILVIAYRSTGDSREYAVLHRSDSDMWQFIAGGGEGDESPDEAARRETEEEVGISGDAVLLRLDATASIPRSAFTDAPWPDTIFVIPQYSFAVDVGRRELVLSREHDGLDWLDFGAASARLTWDSNRVALWELRERLARSG